MYSIVYLVIFIVFFLFVYIFTNYLCITIFNKGKRDFNLKTQTKYRLATNYVYGNRTDNLDIFNNGDLNCSTNEGNLIECDIDPTNELGKNAKCMQCTQIAARCINIKQPIYSSLDPNVIIIQPNTSPNKGYCLPSAAVSQQCTRRNGGRWILTQSDSIDAINDDDDNNIKKDKHLIYKFECYCATSNFFQNDIFNNNDCTRFVGCRNGKLSSDTWSTYEDMRCTCAPNLYTEQLGSAVEPPQCVFLNIYRRTYDDTTLPPFEILADEFIDPQYRELLQETTVNLPNPCTFDLVTKKFIRDIGNVVWNKNRTVAYCKSKHSNYKTIILNDDYLYGNAGKYANAMFRYRIRDTSELNDDIDDNYNNYKNGIMYEVYRKGSSIQHLAGIRLPYSNFPIYLPYLESDSFNMGNTMGYNYTLYPTIPKLRHKYTMIYVFDVAQPDYKIEIILGNGIQYIPSFMSTSFESANRVYNGALPCVNVGDLTYWNNVRAFWIMYPIPPARQFANKLGKTGIMGDLYKINETNDKFTVGYAFHFAFRNNVEPYTELFTGTLFTYTIDDIVYTRPVSCGNRVLNNKYRLNYDSNWRNRPAEKITGYVRNSPFQFALTYRDNHMFTHNSYDLERNEIGLPSRKVARYELNETGSLKFKTFYS